MTGSHTQSLRFQMYGMIGRSGLRFMKDSPVALRFRADALGALWGIGRKHWRILRRLFRKWGSTCSVVLRSSHVTSA